MLRSTLSFLSLLVFGCSSPAHSEWDFEEQQEPVAQHPEEVVTSEPVTVTYRPIRVCLGVYVETQPAALKAIEGWEIATKGWRGWEVVKDTCDLTILEVGPYAKLCRETASACADRIGGLELQEPVAGKVVLVEGKHEGSTTGILMHEIGHLLGLTHKEDGSLMISHWGHSQLDADWECPDSVTVDRLAQRVGVEMGASCSLPEGF